MSQVPAGTDLNVTYKAEERKARKTALDEYKQIGVVGQSY